MISLAGRDIMHAWGKFLFTGVGLGLLIGVTLSMAGIYRGMVDDAKVLLDNSSADLWVVQKDTLGPYAESSSVYDDTWRGIRAIPGVAQAANVTYLTMQVRHGRRDVRAMVTGVTAGGPGTPGWPAYLVSGRQIERLSETGVVLDDGTELPADLVVYATGYGSMNGWVADLIDKETADKVGKVWGLGSDTPKDPGPWEGEQRNMWKPTQQEALWFHGGNLHQSRHYSQYLSLQLKARMEGIDTPVYGLQEVHHVT